MIEAQQAMDTVFAAGTLSTPAGIARSDSERYSERLSDEDAKTAINDARDHLKKAIEKISDLERDNYKHLKQWLEKDDKIFVSTKDFFHRTKK